MKQVLNSILHGNCLDILPLFDSDFGDLAVTSPPYDNLRNYHGYHFDCAQIAKELYRVIKPGGVVVWVVADAVVNGSETGSSLRQALTFLDTGFLLHDTMIYEKNSCTFPASRGGNRYSQTFEFMFVFSKGKPKTATLLCDKPNRWAGTSNWGQNTYRGVDGELRPKPGSTPIPTFSARNNIWRYVPVFEKDDGAKDVVGGDIRRYRVGKQDHLACEHPATFPLALAEDQILTWSRLGDVVLDPLCGSGTSCLAAQRLMRHFIGIDISKRYCDLACRRLGCPSIPSKRKA